VQTPSELRTAQQAVASEAGRKDRGRNKKVRGDSMKNLWLICKWLFVKFCDTKGCMDIHIKKVRPKDNRMKKQKHTHIIKNVYKENNKSAKEILMRSFLLYLKQKCDMI
jgi:hypothetical protein